MYKFHALPLLGAFEWAAHAAGKDDRLPTLTKVHFRFGPADVHPDHYAEDFTAERQPTHALTVAATDQYRMAWASVPLWTERDTEPPAVAPFTMLVSAAELLAVARTWRNRAPRNVLILPDPTLGQVEFVLLDGYRSDQEGFIRGATLPMVANTDDDNRRFPKYHHLVNADGVDPDAKAYAHRVTSTYLRQMLTASAKLPGGGWSWVDFVNDREHKPLRFRATSETVAASGLLMPVRKVS